MIVTNSAQIYPAPSVSVVIPTYNEAKNIEKVIKNFLATNYDNLKEILVVDGESSDLTPKIVADLAQVDTRVKLLNNPLRIQSAALNLALEQSKGEIFLRADAHCEYAPDYIEKCVETLQNSLALNVGGAQRFVATNTWQAGVALASRSPFGSGRAKYRNPDYDGYGETVFLGCFWRDTLLKIGGYALTRKEDSELNFRLLQKCDRAIYINSQIKVWYFPRPTWQGLWRQYIKYGRGSYIMSTRYPEKLPLRNKLPFLLVLIGLLAEACDLIFGRGLLHTKELVLIGFSLICLEALRVTWKFNSCFASVFWRGSEQQPGFFLRWFCCSVALLTMPLAHFTGYGYQLVRRNLMGKDESCFFETKADIKSKDTASSGFTVNSEQ